MPRRAAPVFVLACGLLPAVGVAGQTVERDPDSGAMRWQTTAHGVTLALTQIPPDPARAFYLNRGFPPKAVEGYANACVFMTMLRNDAAPGLLTFRLADWQVRGDGAVRPPKPVQAWMDEWQAMGLPEAAQIAFRWAQFPPDQEYAVGEWNQGMLAIGLPPGSRFDLVARWVVAGESYQGMLEDVVCAR